MIPGICHDCNNPRCRWVHSDESKEPQINDWLVFVNFRDAVLPKGHLLDPSLASVAKSKQVERELNKITRRLHPALFLLSGFCLGELAVLRSCLFCHPSTFAFPEFVTLLACFQNPGAGTEVSCPWRMNPWRVEPFLVFTQSSTSLFWSSACLLHPGSHLMTFSLLQCWTWSQIWKVWAICCCSCWQTSTGSWH